MRTPAPSCGSNPRPLRNLSSDLVEGQRDAAEFGDQGSNTLGHIIDSQHPSLPTLTRLGMLHTLPTPATTDNPTEPNEDGAFSPTLGAGVVDTALASSVDRSRWR